MYSKIPSSDLESPPPEPPDTEVIVLNSSLFYIVFYPISALGCIPYIYGTSYGKLSSMYFK